MDLDLYLTWNIPLNVSAQEMSTPGLSTLIHLYDNVNIHNGSTGKNVSILDLKLNKNDQHTYLTA